MYQFGKTTTKIVPACCVEECTAEADWGKCENCGANFCERHRKEHLVRIDLVFSLGMGPLCYDEKQKPMTPPYGVFFCQECQIKPAPAALIASYDRANEALKLASRFRQLTSANEQPKA